MLRLFSVFLVLKRAEARGSRLFDSSVLLTLPESIHYLVTHINTMNSKIHLIATFIFVLALVSFTTADVPSGFTYGNPSLGIFNFIPSAGANQTLVFDTHVSQPTSICVDNENDVVLFANNALV